VHRAHHRLEANVPWQVLMAMRAHQRRHGDMYNTAHLAPDPEHIPFPSMIIIDQSRTDPTMRLLPYFHTEVRTARGRLPFRLDRQPWEGIPFIHPGFTSIADTAQAGVVYNRVLLERPGAMPLQTWEFSMDFHRRFVALMDVYMVRQEEGDMPPVNRMDRRPGV